MGKKRKLAQRLVEAVGGCFSMALGIDLESGHSQEVFKWFLAAVLFGTRISENTVIKTYHEFERRGVLTPQKILDTGWEGLVQILDSGGYVRYDFKTATKLLQITEALINKYGGHLNRLHEEATGPKDLERRLQEFKGVGPTTTNIFLRELRGIWPKVQPLPSDLAIMAARDLGLTGARTPQRVLSDLHRAFPLELNALTFADFESALVRLGKGFCRKERYALCPMREACRQFARIHRARPSRR